MVRSSIWKEAGLDQGVICLECFMERLGRLLTEEDLTDCAMNKTIIAGIKLGRLLGVK